MVYVIVDKIGTKSKILEIWNPDFFNTDGRENVVQMDNEPDYETNFQQGKTLTVFLNCKTKEYVYEHDFKPLTETQILGAEIAKLKIQLMKFQGGN